MIVAGKFAGDDAEDVMMAQHGVYGDAVRIIHQETKSRVQDAQLLLGVRSEDFKGLDRAVFDHRALQDVHDWLAAIWRAKSGLLSPQLAFDGPHMLRLMSEWLDWLSAFVANCDPVFVRHCGLAVSLENTLRGYEAEEAAVVMLRDELNLVLKR